MIASDLATFLTNFRPDGCITFVGIVPDGSTVAATFNGADQGSAAAKWIEAHNSARGIYYTVNATAPNLRKKPKKSDIIEIYGVWADIDPQDADHDQWLVERERLIALADELHRLDRPPSLIGDSGNGIQPVWLLAEPLEATSEYQATAEVLCSKLEHALGAQGTHNIDRLLRCPGTTNFPNAKKRRQGRTETQASLLYATWHRYGWGDLETLVDRLECNPPPHAIPIKPNRQDNGAEDHSGTLTPEALKELRKALQGETAHGWHNAMLKVIGRLVHDGASDWFIRDWAFQYRWPEYSEDQTLRDVDAMIAGARAKGYHKAKAKAPSSPQIDVVGGNLAANVRAAIAALQQAKVPIYDRGGLLVRPVEQATPAGRNSDSISRPSGAMILAPVTPDWIRLQLAEVAAWRRFDGRTEKWKPCDPPIDVARTVIAAPDEGRWPYLRAIVRHPVLLPSGRRITAQGYDPETCLLIDSPGSWPDIPDHPTRDDAAGAVEALQHLLHYFPWSTDADCAVALSLFLTALASPLLDAVPGHAIDSPEAGTGKTLLVNAAAILATGNQVATLDYGHDPDEAAKRLDSALLAGDPIICLDNIEAPLEGAALCQTITARARAIRLLGSQTKVSVPCNVLIAATGNNITLRGDIVRRMPVCRIDAKVERPEERQIPQDLLAEVTESRGEIVRLAHTIMAAYIHAGHPKIHALPQFGSFEDWCSMVRYPLVWAGAEDPIETVTRARLDDPSVQARHIILNAWHDAVGPTPSSVANIIALAEARAENAAPELKDALALVSLASSKLDGHRLGKWLRKNRNIRVGKLTLQRTDEFAHGGGLKWRVFYSPD